MRVLLDNNVVEPGAVVFGRRTQTLSSTLEGAIGGCLSLVTNLAAGLSPEPLDHRDVLAVGADAAGDVGRLLRTFIERT